MVVCPIPAAWIADHSIHSMTSRNTSLKRGSIQRHFLSVVTWDAAIAKCQKLHKEFNREQAIDYLRKTNSGKAMETIATIAEVVKTELS